LKKMGYDGAEVIGLFLMPHVDRGSTRGLSLGNTYAALRELAHFSLPTSNFRAQYTVKEGTVHEQGPPFARSFLLELPEPGKEHANKELIDLAGEFLARELLHPMGRTADFSRAVLPPALQPSTGPVCHAFGIERFAFPRRPFVHEGARSICRRLL